MPFLRNQVPAPNSIAVPLDTNIYLEIADDGIIDGYSIEIAINGQLAYDNETEQAGFSINRRSISDGYSFEINPDCNFNGGIVTVDAYAVDADGYVLDTSYSFSLNRLYIFEDDFNDGIIGIEVTPRNGNITESGGTINLSIPDGVDGDYWHNVNNAPFAHVDANWIQNDTLELVYTGELVSWSYIDSNVAGGFNLYGSNASQNAYTFVYNPSTGALSLRYFENGSTNSFGSSTTIPDPSVTPTRMRIRWDVLSDLLTFEYSTDDCTWTELGTRTTIFTPEEIGFWIKNYSSDRATSASWNFLTISEKKSIAQSAYTSDSGFSDENDFPDNVSTVGTRHTFPQNNPRFDPTNDVEKSAAMLDEQEFPSHAAGDTKHTFPQQATGQLERPVMTGMSDAIELLLGTSDIRAESQTVDTEGHPHFIGRRAYVSYFYDGYDDPWSNPTTTNFTGYARDGYKYTNGILDAGPVLAPWAAEIPSNDRSSRRDFPINALIVGTLSEVVIFDMDGYDLTGNTDVWMRFKYGSAGGYYLIGPTDGRYITDMAFKDGVLYYVQQEGGERGAFNIVDFRALGQDFTYLARSDYDRIGDSGRDITYRNETGNRTDTGAPGGRIASESLQSVSAYFTSRSTVGDYDEWYAVCGEDNVSLVHRANVSGVKTVTGGLYEAQGDTGPVNTTTYRRVLFDKTGLLWFSIDKRLQRNIYNYRDLSIVASSHNTPGKVRTVVQLPHIITYLTDGPAYLFVGTTAGIYVVHKGTMEYHLAYTIEGGGGGGLINSPPAGELLVGENSSIESIRSFSTDSVAGEIGFISVATGYTTDKSGGTTVIRLLDEKVISSQEFPQLAEDGAYFPELIII